ncbi:restriction endonuclease subunit S [Pseudomonas baetica]|uniref:restriction endonuclease subunit S n=1 Tax=Pseudomonas baetica TaxID=674054 RepID=UPI0028720FB0|nr:restriction endonuclease subunit S [Pseudomonas baetica]MDR9860397.1 restriction endonuclease subunit S [Pseudomonas baetica]
MIPDGWTLKKLGDLALVERGRFTARPRNDPDYFGGSFPFVQTGDVASAGTYLSSHSQTLNDKGLSVSKLFPKDTILLTIAANIGETTIASYNVACPDSVVGIQAYEKIADVYWLKKVLETKKGDLDAQATQNAQKNINLQTLKPLAIATPPLEEQRKIAKILSIWDEAITITESLLFNSKQQKKSLMGALLKGKKRLPEFYENWGEFSFKKIFKERIETGNPKLPLLSITSEGGVINRDNIGRKDTSNADKSKYLRICQGDIGYNTMRMWQGVAGLSNQEGIVSPAYTVLTPQAEIDPLYAAYLFKLPELIHVFYRYSQGMVSDTWNLKYSHFSKIKWFFPEVSEQKAIASILSTADQEIEALRQKLACLKQEKKALMQQLLTGKRRVKVEAA